MFKGPALVSVVLDRLDINRESVLVIRNGTIVPNDTRLEDDDEIEIRPVISGGALDLSDPGSLAGEGLVIPSVRSQGK